MAIDRTGISSLDTGASDITYSGNEGPQDPRAMTDMTKLYYNTGFNKVDLMEMTFQKNSN